MSNYVAFRASPELLGQIAERGASAGLGPGLVARRDLERYYRLLQATLRTVTLTEAEASLIADALDGTIGPGARDPLPSAIGFLWAGVELAIRVEGLDRKWGVDGQALVQRLHGLSYAQSLAVLDAVERLLKHK